MMKAWHRKNRTRALLLAAALACVAIPPSGVYTEALAVTIYSYIDDQGNPVYTDAPETIPEKYRPRVKTHERHDPVTATPSMMEAVKQTVAEPAKNLGIKAPSFQFGMGGLSPAQSQILTYAGAAAVFLLVVIYLSKSQLVRMLGFSLLLVVGIGAPVLMYVSDGGPMGSLQNKTATTGQLQQDRLQQLPR
jgi:hypothetical protein